MLILSGICFRVQRVAHKCNQGIFFPKKNLAETDNREGMRGRRRNKRRDPEKRIKIYLKFDPPLSSLPLILPFSLSFYHTVLLRLPSPKGPERKVLLFVMRAQRSEPGSR